jgi:hypothetical protein
MAFVALEDGKYEMRFNDTLVPCVTHTDCQESEEAALRSLCLGNFTTKPFWVTDNICVCPVYYTGEDRDQSSVV